MYKPKHNFVDEVIRDRDIARADCWHAVMTPPFGELRAATILRALGVLVYVPLARVKRKTVKRGRLEVKHVSVQRAAFPPYILVGFRMCSPDWWLLYQTQMIKGVVAVNGAAYCVEHETIKQIALDQRRGRFNDRCVTPGRRAVAAPQAGERWQTRPEFNLRGEDVVVQCVEDDCADVLFQMFGKSNLATIPLDALLRRV